MHSWEMHKMKNTSPAKTNSIPHSYPYQFHIKVSHKSFSHKSYQHQFHNSTSNNLVWENNHIRMFSTDSFIIVKKKKAGNNLNINQ